MEKVEHGQEERGREAPVRPEKEGIMKTITIRLPAEFAQLVLRAVRAYEAECLLTRKESWPHLQEVRQEQVRAATVAEILESALKRVK